MCKWLYVRLINILALYTLRHMPVGNAIMEMMNTPRYNIQIPLPCKYVLPYRQILWDIPTQPESLKWGAANMLDECG